MDTGLVPKFQLPPRRKFPAQTTFPVKLIVLPLALLRYGLFVLLPNVSVPPPSAVVVLRRSVPLLKRVPPV